ncbi:peptidoglycan recognition protein family protein [Bythopirellula polymerisocia]|uniref:N-acetylmuramoyl-L-alanine amidase n=1 Tax=Bythopirellula polymerisocia TaxID=2528003 RepID=A0A5C6D3N1_9BACT|nr:peptidoglycan recognition family protein [Bythopirellula polymerisocia]TWU29836.1 N-acetylmuramoyl-L-alanine amidase [Bythopirellula polymerisocia]
MNRFYLKAPITGVLLLILFGNDVAAAEWVEVARPPNFVSAQEWGSQPDPIPEARKHQPKYVTLHHAGVLWTVDRDPVEFIRNMQLWGKRRPEIEQPPRNTYWPDLPYHFLIAPDGRIFEGRSLDYEPESNTNYELAGHLGVELMGNFEEQRPSLEQVESAVRLVAWLVAKYDLHLEAISTHSLVAKGQTSCPGRDFSRYFEGSPWQFKSWVTQVLLGKDPQIDLGQPLENGPTELITETKPRDK